MGGSSYDYVRVRPDPMDNPRGRQELRQTRQSGISGRDEGKRLSHCLT